MTSLLVIGVGTPFRGDDAVGLEVARRVQEAASPGVVVCQQRGESTALLAAWEGATNVILVDAAHSAAPAGTIHRFEAAEESLPAHLFPAASSHAWGVIEAIELARQLDLLPQRLLVYGIEGADFTVGVEGLSPTVTRAADLVVDEILAAASPESTP